MLLFDFISGHIGFDGFFLPSQETTSNASTTVDTSHVPRGGFVSVPVSETSGKSPKQHRQ